MIMMRNKYHYIDLKLYYFHNKPNRRSKDSVSNFVQLARILQREGLIGWLLKFAKPKNWHAMILAIDWFATKTCQPLTFGLPNPWQNFYLILDCQILVMVNFVRKPIRPREGCCHVYGVPYSSKKIKFCLL